MDYATAHFAESGYIVLPQCMNAARLASLRSELASGMPGAGRRTLLADSQVIRDFAAYELAALLEPFGPENHFPVRVLLFDKSPRTNWNVPWHQDEFIAVAERNHVDGFGGWSVKEGVWHAQAPRAVLERMLTVRLHLDDCAPENGPLRVIPGSHRLGRLDVEAIADCRAKIPAEEIHCRAGDALVMRPLLLHASSKAARPFRRRVLHVEFASEELPGGLEWAATTSLHQRPASVPAGGKS